MDEHDWFAGWIDRERVETVANEQISTDTRVSAGMIADTAGVDVDTVRSVVHKMADRGTITIVERAGREWYSRQPDYSDALWQPVDSA